MPTPPTTVQEVTNPGYIFPAFRPAELVLCSPELIDAENASLAISCATVTDDCVLTLNGYTFRAAVKEYEELDYGEFQALSVTDSICSRSLQLAILATPLADDYYVSEAGQSDGTVTLLAKHAGPAYNVVATVDAGTIGVTPFDANPFTASQRTDLLNWGVFVNPYIDAASRSWGEGYAGVNDYQLTALPRLELPYNPSNRYVFDLSPYLQAYLSPAVTNDQGSWQYSRMISLAARYGGIWNTATSSYRKEWEDGRWPSGGYNTSNYSGGGIVWAIASTDYIADGGGCFQHEQHQLARPLYCYYDEDYAATLYVPYFSALTQANIDVYWRCQWLLTDGTTYTNTGSATTGANRGGIHDLNTYPTTSDDITPNGVVEVIVESLDPSDDTAVIDTLRFVNIAGPNDTWLAFVSRCGGLERWNFTDTPDEMQKRVLSTFQRADDTTQMARVDLTPVTRYYSRLLDKDQWDFLVTELQASPAVYLLDRYRAPIPVVVGDFDAKGDAITGEYTISLEVTPAASVNTLSQ